MDAGVSSARQARSQHRHDLRSLTYVTIDQANGGVVRNLNRGGIGAQVVAALRPKQQVRMRFDLGHPRVRVEALGEVVWATYSGQCGIRFLDLSPRTRKQIQEWIFGDLLQGAALHSLSAESMFGGPALGTSGEDHGLLVSATPVTVIELPVRQEHGAISSENSLQLDWLSQPLSGRGLAWTVNALVVFAALLLFVLVFLSVNRETPPWPLAMTGGAAVLMGALYWGFFRFVGGGTLGDRLARLADSGDDGEDDARFR
jgi:hypothetical protein